MLPEVQRSEIQYSLFEIEGIIEIIVGENCSQIPL